MSGSLSVFQMSAAASRGRAYSRAANMARACRDASTWMEHHSPEKKMSFKSGKHFTDAEIELAIATHLNARGDLPCAESSAEEAAISEQEKTAIFREKKVLWPRRKNSYRRILPDEKGAA
ncbi:hypothetical protein [Herbaspirillum robiniae]|uniref:hypothetical protein n=1 Tax=Herbaspirillum robiniae TaxID=2014887 RepID=UPI003D78B226